MVNYSYGNRNFMQPMGGLNMHSKFLDYFSFKFWVGGGGGGFFSFSLCSQHVPKVPNVFPKGVPNSTSF
jgi:hypothetical protein